jgi:hypothetical protein
MLLWLRRIAVILISVFIGLYMGDWAVYRLRGSPQSRVTVSRFLTVPLKGNKTEIDDLGTQDVPCSKSLFAQSGDSPCWRLRRNTSQDVKM